MILLSVYWNSSLFLCVILPALICLALSFLSLYHEENDSLNTISFIASFIFATILLFDTLFCIWGGSKFSMNELRSEMDGKIAAQEERYYNVAFLGKKPVEQNPSDGRYYINMGKGQMVGYHEVMAMGKCRACDQFKNYEMVDSVYAYRVYLSDRSWFNEPLTFFSKRPDIVIEAAMVREVK